jgi:hypothetical protein
MAARFIDKENILYYKAQLECRQNTYFEDYNQDFFVRMARFIRLWLTLHQSYIKDVPLKPTFPSSSVGRADGC